MGIRRSRTGTEKETLMHAPVLGIIALCVSCGGADDDHNALSIKWRFASGDCASNKVDRVKVTVTPPGGAAATYDFACSAASGDLGKISAGSYGINADGRDASGAS